jgi:hypothetical protein
MPDLANIMSSIGVEVHLQIRDADVEHYPHGLSAAGHDHGRNHTTGSRGLNLMKKFMLLMLLLLCIGCAKKEPLYQGKAAGQWTSELRAPDAKARRTAAGALAALKAKPAVPDLIVALKDQDSGVRAGAAEALWSIGPDARDAVPDLTTALADPFADVRLNAVGALGEIGAPANCAIPAVNGLLKDRDENVRVSAAQALAKFGPEARTAVPGLTDSLRASDKALRVAAAYALAAIGRDASSAIPVLRSLAQEKDGDVCTAAAYAIKQIEGGK